MIINHLPPPTPKKCGYSQYKHCLRWNGIPSDEIKLYKREAKLLIKYNRALMLRNCFDWDIASSTNFWEVICDKFYPIEELPAKTRNQIRRCLRDCNIKRISAYELIKFDGYHVYKEAFGRYHDITISILDRASWESIILNDHIHEFWGVFEKDTTELIAWAMNTVDIYRVQYNSLKAIPEKMNKHYPYYGLIYEMNRYYLEKMGCKYVSDGWRSVTEHSGIQPFLERNFHFRKAYVKMKLYYTNWLKIIIWLLFPLRHFSLLPLKVRNLLKFEEINRQSSEFNF